MYVLTYVQYKANHTGNTKAYHYFSVYKKMYNKLDTLKIPRPSTR